MVNKDKYIFGKIGRNASEEVILELIRSKCIPILIYEGTNGKVD